MNQPDPADITLAITADGVLHWNGKPCSEEVLDDLMAQAADAQPLPEVQMKVDARVEYGLEWPASWPWPRAMVLVNWRLSPCLSPDTPESGNSTPRLQPRCD